MVFLCAGLVMTLGCIGWSIWCGARHGGAWWFVLAPPILGCLFTVVGTMATMSATVRGLTGGMQRNVAAEEMAALGNIMFALAALMLLASFATNLVATIRAPRTQVPVDRRA